MEKSMPCPQPSPTTKNHVNSVYGRHARSSELFSPITIWYVELVRRLSEQCFFVQFTHGRLCFAVHRSVVSWMLCVVLPQNICGTLLEKRYPCADSHAFSSSWVTFSWRKLQCWNSVPLLTFWVAGIWLHSLHYVVFPDFFLVQSQRVVGQGGSPVRVAWYRYRLT